MAVKTKNNTLSRNNYEKELITLTEATKYCNYSQEYLSLRARSKKLKSVKVGRNWMTTMAWLDEYLKKIDDYKEQVSPRILKSEVHNEPATTENQPAVSPEPEAPVAEDPEPEEILPQPEEAPKTESVITSKSKKVCPPKNIPTGEDDLLRKYLPLDIPAESLRFGYVAAFTVTMVFAGFVLGSDAISVFANDMKQFGDLVLSGSGTIGTDMAQAGKYALSYSVSIFGGYLDWLSSLIF